MIKRTIYTKYIISNCGIIINTDVVYSIKEGIFVVPISSI